MQSDVVRLQNELKAVREAYKGQISKLQQQKVKGARSLRRSVRQLPRMGLPTRKV